MGPVEIVTGAAVMTFAYYVGLLMGSTRARQYRAERDLARKEAGKLSRRIGNQRYKITELKKTLSVFLPKEDRRPAIMQTEKASMTPSAPPRLPH